MTLSDKLREVMAQWERAKSKDAVRAYEESCGALVWKHGPELLRALEDAGRGETEGAANERIWFCKIGGDVHGLPRGADGPMRDAVSEAYRTLTGTAPRFIFSGWGGKLSEPERAVVEDRLPKDAAIDQARQS